MGLCFSVPRAVKCPPSLKNIYKCIKSDKEVKNFKVPQHGDLKKWANQGVFLLNTVLTVIHSKANSHRKQGWEKFTNFVIEKINSDLQNVIFLLWGKPAQKMEKLIDGKKHFILKSSHPSPLSAFRGFLTCGHFSEVNKILKKLGKKEIDWNFD